MATKFFTNNGTKYRVRGITAGKLNNALYFQAFEKFGDKTPNLNDSETATLMEKFGNRISKVEPQGKDMATRAQLSYLDILGVNVGDAKLTKRMASRVIDSVKSGNGVGAFGLTFFDGSQ